MEGRDGVNLQILTSILAAQDRSRATRRYIRVVRRCPCILARRRGILDRDTALFDHVMDPPSKVYLQSPRKKDDGD